MLDIVTHRPIFLLQQCSYI